MRFEHKRAALGKIEVTYGTDPTPTGAANYLEVYDLSMPGTEYGKSPRMPVRPFGGSIATVLASTPFKRGFGFKLAGAGAAGTAPAWGPILRACGMSETISAGVDVTYAPVSTGFEAMTFWDNLDGVNYKGNGCRGNAQIEFAHNDLPGVKADLTGIYAAPADAALPTVTTTAWKDPVPFNKTNSTPFTFHGVAAVCSKLSLDMGRKISWKDYPGADSTVTLTPSDVTGSITLQAELQAVKNWESVAEARTLAALTLTNGLTGGNKIKLDASNVQILDVKYEASDGIVMVTLPLLFVQVDASTPAFTLKAL